MRHNRDYKPENYSVSPRAPGPASRLPYPFPRVATHRQESVSVDISIPHQGLCMCPCLFLKWLSFHSLCVATAFSCCKSQLECHVRDAIFDHPIRFFYHFLSQLVFFLHRNLEIIHFTVFPAHSDICSMRQELISLVDSCIPRADLSPD